MFSNGDLKVTGIRVFFMTELNFSYGQWLSSRRNKWRNYGINKELAALSHACKLRRLVSLRKNHVHRKPRTSR